MKRYVEIGEISDGKLYESNDLVKVGCNECSGCSSCCGGMGNSIILDPYDVYRITIGLGESFQGLLMKQIELNVVDGLILPNIKMDNEKAKCSFLNKDGRCSIHEIRPGICRLFPLGRVYDDGGFKYFLQKDECKKTNRTKVKVSKWVDTPDLPKYEKFVTDWHYFLNKLEKRVKELDNDDIIKSINMNLLKNFYLTPYDPQKDFYSQFYYILDTAEALMNYRDNV